MSEVPLYETPISSRAITDSVATFISVGSALIIHRPYGRQYRLDIGGFLQIRFRDTSLSRQRSFSAGMCLKDLLNREVQDETTVTKRAQHEIHSQGIWRS